MRFSLTLGLILVLPMAAMAQDGAIAQKRAEFRANRDARVEQAKSLREQNKAERQGLRSEVKAQREQRMDARQQKRQEHINKAQDRLNAAKARQAQ